MNVDIIYSQNVEKVLTPVIVFKTIGKFSVGVKLKWSKHNFSGNFVISQVKF